MKNQELNEAYELINNVVKNKIRILIEEDLYLYEQNADVYIITPMRLLKK